MCNRQERIKSYKEFFNSSKSIFESFSKDDKSHKRLEALFSFYISPGGRILQYNDKLIEVFYGGRSIGIKKTLGDNFNIKEKAELAEGATLQYSRTDDGHVACYLYPAKSDNKRPIEDFIVLDYVKDPRQLESKAKIHWKLFVAYMDSTCIDGELDLIQKFMVFYLKNFKEYVVGGITQERKIKTYLTDVSKYVLTIGFSGFMILLITSYMEGMKNQNEKTSMAVIKSEIALIKQEAQKITEQLKKANLHIDEAINGHSESSQREQALLLRSNSKLEEIDSSIEVMEGTIADLEKAYNKSLQVTPKSGAPEL